MAHGLALLQSFNDCGGPFSFIRGFIMNYENKRKCTLKERRAVCKILAARDGLERSNENIINKVAAMSDADILNFLDAETEKAAANIEILPAESVEVIAPGGGSDYEKIYNTLVDIVKNYIAANNWDGEKITPLQWGACCMAAGRFARSRSWFRGIPENENTQKGIKEINAAKGIDAQAVAGALPVWLELCALYNKTPLKSDFMHFCGVYFDWLFDNRGGVTSERASLLQKLDKIQADGLRARVINPKESPIGAIFLLKADHGLQETQKVTHEYIKSDNDAAALPVFGSFDGITDKTGEKDGF